MQTVRGETEAVIEERRPVELVHLYMVGDRVAEQLHLLPTFTDHGGELRPNPVAARLDARAVRRARAGRRPRLLHAVAQRGGRAALATSRCCRRSCSCSAARAATRRSTSAWRRGCASPTSTERRELRRIAERHTAALSDDDLDVLGYDSWLAGLEAGVAAHHAGMVPPMKEAVEEAFAAGLLKVVFATETLSLGINMPARSVVIEKLSKFTGEHHEFLTPGEYTQLAGRAGRRGIDDRRLRRRALEPVRGVRTGRRARVAAHVRAHVVVPADVQHGRQPRAAVPARAGPPPAQPVVRAVPRRPRRRVARAPARTRQGATRARSRRPPPIPAATWRSTGGSSPTSTRRKRTAQGRPDPAARRAPARRRRARAPARRQGRRPQAGPRPGRQPRARAHRRARPRAARPERLPRPGPEGRDDRAAPPVRAAQPGLPTGRGRRAAPADRSTTSRGGRRPPTRSSRDLEAGVRAHPLHELAGLATRACGPRRRPTASNARSRASNAASATRNESLARQFDRVLGVLEAWGYLEGWGLSPAGELLARLNTEGDLVLAEVAARGAARRARPARARRARVVLHVPAARPGRQRAAAAAPLAELDGRAAGRATSSASGATSTCPSATSGCPRPAAPIPASPRRSTPGRRATTSPTCSRTRR